MTQDDIDRLLAARKLIDDTRDLKAQVRKLCAPPKEKVTVTAADYEPLQDQLTALIALRDKGLKELGFDSIAEVVKFNDEMELAEIKECLEYVQVCDQCKGYKGTPPCTKTCGKGQSWYDKWTGSKENYDYLYKLSLEVTVKYTTDDTADKIKADPKHSLINVDNLIQSRAKRTVGDTYKTGYCPDGHGFVIKINKIAAFPHWSID
jgi:hypothetical protein